MRLQTKLKQYLLLLILTQYICTSFAHINNDHQDSVSNKHEHLNDDRLRHYEDEHFEDSIDARLRAKHALRNSINDFSGEDTEFNESEEEYIKRLNDPLENKQRISNEKLLRQPILNTVNQETVVPTSHNHDKVELNTASTTLTTENEKNSQAPTNTITQAPPVVVPADSIVKSEEKSDLHTSSVNAAENLLTKAQETQSIETIKDNYQKEDSSTNSGEESSINQSHQEGVKLMMSPDSAKLANEPAHVETSLKSSDTPVQESLKQTTEAMPLVDQAQKNVLNKPDGSFNEEKIITSDSVLPTQTPTTIPDFQQQIKLDELKSEKKLQSETQSTTQITPTKTALPENTGREKSPKISSKTMPEQVQQENLSTPIAETVTVRPAEQEPQKVITRSPTPAETQNTDQLRDIPTTSVPTTKQYESATITPSIHQATQATPNVIPPLSESQKSDGETSQRLSSASVTEPTPPTAAINPKESETQTIVNTAPPLSESEKIIEQQTLTTTSTPVSEPPVQNTAQQTTQTATPKPSTATGNPHRVVRAATSRLTQKAQARQRQVHQKHVATNQPSDSSDAANPAETKGKESELHSTVSATATSTFEVPTSTAASVVDQPKSTPTIYESSKIDATVPNTQTPPVVGTPEFYSVPQTEAEKANEVEMGKNVNVENTTVVPVTIPSVHEENKSVNIEISTNAKSVEQTLEPSVTVSSTETIDSVKTSTPSDKSSFPDLVSDKEKDTSILPDNSSYEISTNDTSHLKPDVNLENTDTNDTLNNSKPIGKELENDDLPRQVHVHNTETLFREQAQLNSIESEAGTQTATPSATDATPHIPRNVDNQNFQETLTSTTIVPGNEQNFANDLASKNDDVNQSMSSSPTPAASNTLANLSEKIVHSDIEKVCLNIPNFVQSSLILIGSLLLKLATLLPDSIQTILFEGVDNPELFVNRVWLGSSCVLCLLFSLMPLWMGTKHLKHSKNEKEIRARCQQLQQHNNQLELERETFERRNQKLTDEIEELKNLPAHDTDEDLFEVKESLQRLQIEYNQIRIERDTFYTELTQAGHLIQRHEFDIQSKTKIIQDLSNEIEINKRDLDEQRALAKRLQTSDLSLERFEKLQETIDQSKSEILQLKHENLSKIDEIQTIQEQTKSLELEKNQLTMKMKQLKELIEQRDETIVKLRDKVADENEDETTDVNDGKTDGSVQLLSTIDSDVEKANDHLRKLLTEVEEKNRHIKELDSLLKQEKERYREIETKLKVVYELRERDAHLHIRQLGQTDAELRKARSDTERVKILTNQLEMKQKQIDDIQKVMTSEQMKFTEESTKYQHEIHEKWMEIKRISRELETSKKECEGLRRQITKYANKERSSQEKQVLKPVAQHLNNTNRSSNDIEANGNSPPPAVSSCQPHENFRPIDHQRNDSGAASPSEVYQMRPPMFPMPRPPFFPPPFMGPPPNPFMMGPRFPMAMPGPHGMISPISNLMSNGSAGGSDANSFEIVDSTNITPNSTSYEAPLNGSAMSPTPEEQPSAEKTKKTKKSTKKKTKTPNATSTATKSTTQEV